MINFFGNLTVLNMKELSKHTYSGKLSLAVLRNVAFDLNPTHLPTSMAKETWKAVNPIPGILAGRNGRRHWGHVTRFTTGVMRCPAP
jgi:hypothetical protein